jgi:hypothetical protein
MKELGWRSVWPLLPHALLVIQKNKRKKPLKTRVFGQITRKKLENTVGFDGNKNSPAIEIAATGTKPASAG